MADVLGVSVIGAGELGSRHARFWKAMPGVRVVFVADVNEERARALAEEIGCRHTTDPRQAIEEAGVNIVSVCTPTYLHPELSLYAMERGRHVLTEKPIALTLEDADAMIAAAKRHGVHLAVGLMHRFNPLLPRLEELVQSGAVGRPVVFRDITTAQIRPKRLMHGKYANGGPVIDFCVHLFDDWARLFQSPAVEIMAWGAVFGEGKPELEAVKPLAVDTASFIVRYGSGDVAHMNISWGLPSGIELGTVHQDVIGPEGIIRIEPPNRLRVDRGGGRVTTWEGPPVNPFEEEIRQFLREVRDGAPRRTATGEEARAALRLCLATLEAIERGAPVRLDDAGRAGEGVGGS